MAKRFNHGDTTALVWWQPTGNGNWQLQRKPFRGQNNRDAINEFNAISKNGNWAVAVVNESTGHPTHIFANNATEFTNTLRQKGYIR